MDEFRSAMGALPQDGIEASAQALFQALEGSADRREDYWKNRVQPFWQQAWPKSRDLVTPRLAERLILLCHISPPLRRQDSVAACRRRCRS